MTSDMEASCKIKRKSQKFEISDIFILISVAEKNQKISRLHVPGVSKKISLFDYIYQKN